MKRQFVRAMAASLALLFCVTALGQTPPTQGQTPATQGQMQAAQGQEDYLDVFSCRVKPEKRSDFDALARKISDANRANDGDRWIAMEATYGEGNLVNFVSTRRSYGELDQANEAFMKAMATAMGGQANVQKAFADFNATLNSSRSEFRRRRWDLSSNAPSDPAARAKLVGAAKWIRTTMVRVRLGHGPDFEAMLKELKAAREKTTPQEITLVSQAVAGQTGTVFYISTLKSSMAGFDGGTPMPQLLGQEGYQRFLKVSADSVVNTESAIYRLLPDLSNPPPEVASVASEFWTPQPAVTAAATPATTPGKMAAKPRAKAKK